MPAYEMLVLSILFGLASVQAGVLLEPDYGESDYDELLPEQYDRSDASTVDGIDTTSLAATTNNWVSKPGDVMFHPATSRSFKLIEKAHTVMQNFVDGEAFRGFDAEDNILLGPLTDRTRFCCMTESVGPAFNQPHIQGILGLAFANFTSSPSLLKTLSQQSRPSWGISNGKPKLQPIDFAIFSGQLRGEVHFGTIDAQSRAAEPVYTAATISSDSHSAQGYMVKIVGMKLLEPSPTKSLVSDTLTATLDTGSSCSILPQELSSKISALPISTLIEIVFAPNSRVNLTVEQFGCQVPSTSSSAVLLGTPIFQAFVVEFRLGRKPPLIGFAPINRNYKFSDKAVSASEHKLGFKVISSSPSSTVFETKVGIGSPPQYLHAIVDTGSAMLAVRCDNAQIKRISLHLNAKRAFRKS
jgi:hypothetical protein